MQRFELGGEIRFQHKVVDLTVQDGRLRGLVVQNQASGATYEQRALSDRAHLALTLAEAREARIWRRLGLSDVIGPRKKPLGGQASLAISERASVAAGVGVSPYALVEGARAPSQGVNFIADADRLGANYENFADEFSTILSRQLNEG